MGARGPVPKPSALEAAQGNPGHRPVNRDEPQAPSGEPPMPRGLSSAEKKIWAETVAVLGQIPGLLSQTDSDILAGYARAVAKQQVLEFAMQAETKRRLKSFDTSVTSKEEIIAETMGKYELRMLRWTRMVTQLGDRLGLNAAARSRMHVEGPTVLPPPQTPEQEGLFGQTQGGFQQLRPM